MDLNSFLAKALEFTSQVLAQLSNIIKQFFTPQILGNIWSLLKTIGIYAIKFIVMILNFIINLLKSLLPK
ncbi:MAG: hypothetical protein ACPLW7_03265 [Minisyncoccia bacterium]|jgi:archaellum biogenesis protein FlaJ (TadC family)